MDVQRPLADHGMLLARTGEVEQRHHDLTWFAFDMEQSGVEVRPLREMTGDRCSPRSSSTMRSPATKTRGRDRRGMGVARTTLMNERVGLGGAGGSLEASRASGRHAEISRGRRHRDEVAQSSGTSLVMSGRPLIGPSSWQRNDRSTRTSRDRVAALYVFEEVAQMTQRRLATEGPTHPSFTGLGSISKYFRHAPRKWRATSACPSSKQRACSGPTTVRWPASCKSTSCSVRRRPSTEARTRSS